MRYIYILTPIIAWLVSQILKFMFENMQQKKLRWDLFIRSGGMPSAHSASTASLTTLIGLNEGFTSPIFAVAALFCLVVMYDARGVRYASGKQATYLNILVSELKDELENSEAENLELLKTEIGHSALQVLVGLAVGISIAFIMNSL